MISPSTSDYKIEPKKPRNTNSSIINTQPLLPKLTNPNDIPNFKINPLDEEFWSKNRTSYSAIPDVPRVNISHKNEVTSTERINQTNSKQKDKLRLNYYSKQNNLLPGYTKPISIKTPNFKNEKSISPKNRKSFSSSKRNDEDAITSVPELGNNLNLTTEKSKKESSNVESYPNEDIRDENPESTGIKNSNFIKPNQENKFNISRFSKKLKDTVKNNIKTSSSTGLVSRIRKFIKPVDSKQTQTQTTGNNFVLNTDSSIQIFKNFLKTKSKNTKLKKEDSQIDSTVPEDINSKSSESNTGKKSQRTKRRQEMCTLSELNSDTHLNINKPKCKEPINFSKAKIRSKNIYESNTKSNINDTDNDKLGNEKMDIKEALADLNKSDSITDNENLYFNDTILKQKRWNPINNLKKLNCFHESSASMPKRSYHKKKE
jgi:hypothetical protein